MLYGKKICSFLEYNCTWASEITSFKLFIRVTHLNGRILAENEINLSGSCAIESMRCFCLRATAIYHVETCFLASIVQIVDRLNNAVFLRDVTSFLSHYLMFLFLFGALVGWNSMETVFLRNAYLSLYTPSDVRIKIKIVPNDIVWNRCRVWMHVEATPSIAYICVSCIRHLHTIVIYLPSELCVCVCCFFPRPLFCIRPKQYVDVQKTSYPGSEVQKRYDETMWKKVHKEIQV